MLLKYLGTETTFANLSQEQQNRILVARIMAGERQAEALFVDLFTPAVKFTLKRAIRDAADGDDIFQETFRIALEKIRQGKVRCPERLGGFVIKVAKYAAISFYRNATRYQSLKDGDEEVTPSDKPLQGLITQETCSWLRGMIPGLKCARDRQVLQRFYLDEEDKQTICEDLGMTSKNFNQIIYRAKKRLKKIIRRDPRFAAVYRSH